MYFLVIQYSSLVKQNVTNMNRNITIQHNHADKLREGQDMNKKENHSVKSVNMTFFLDFSPFDHTAIFLGIKQTSAKPFPVGNSLIIV